MNKTESEEFDLLLKEINAIPDLNNDERFLIFQDRLRKKSSYQARSKLLKGRIEAESRNE